MSKGVMVQLSALLFQMDVDVVAWVQMGQVSIFCLSNVAPGI